MLCIVLFIASMATAIILFSKAKGKYDEDIIWLDVQKYPLKRFLPIGLKLMDIANYKYSTKYDQKLLRRLAEIYGAQKAAFYLRVHWASKLVYALLVILLFSFFGSIIWLQNLAGFSNTNQAMLINGNELQKPEFGEGSREIHLKADIAKGGLKQERQYRISIPEEAPPNDEAAVNKALERLNANLIKGANKSLGSVSSGLNLRKAYNELGNTGVSIEWKSSNTAAVDTDGSVVLPPDDKPVTVALTAVLSRGGIIREKSFNVQIIKAPMTEEQMMSSIIQELENKIKEIKGDTGKEDKVRLPVSSSRFKDVIVAWLPLDGEKKDNGIPEIVFAFLAAALVFYLMDHDVSAKVEKRRLHIRYDFPDFLNKLVLLVNAGMTVKRAMEKIVLDSSSGSPLYAELKTVMADMAGGKPEHQALEEFANRCRIPEVSKFVSLLLQNLTKGSSELVSILLLLSGECWEMRKNTAKRMGEEASTKLLLPMMLMLIAILMIVATPAVLAMNGF